MSSSYNYRLCYRKNAVLKQVHANQCSTIDIKRSYVSKSLDSDLSKLQERLSSYKRRQSASASNGNLSAYSSNGSLISASSSVSIPSLEDGGCCQSAPDIRVLVSPEPSPIDRNTDHGCACSVPGCRPALSLSLRHRRPPPKPLDQQRARRNSTAMIELRRKSMSPVFHDMRRCSGPAGARIRSSPVTRTSTSSTWDQPPGFHLNKRFSFSNCSLPNSFITSGTIDENKTVVTQTPVIKPTTSAARPLVLKNIKANGPGQTIKIATPLSLKPPTSKLKKPGNRQRSKSLDNMMSEDVTPSPSKPKKSTLSPGAQVEKRRSLPEVIKKGGGGFLPELVVTCPDED